LKVCKAIQVCPSRLKAAYKVKKWRNSFMSRGCMTQDPRPLFHTMQDVTPIYIHASNIGHAGLNTVPETQTVPWLFQSLQKNIQITTMKSWASYAQF
jgi:hypothetical protein